jgi:hypothetical protein
MSDADSSSALPWRVARSDRELMRRTTPVLVVLFVFVAAFGYLERMYSQKFFDQTGRAEWIWGRREITRGTPLAFYATRNFDLPASRYYVRIKIAGDPEYTLYFNGAMVGARHMSDRNRRLDVYDVTSLARTQGNRIAVALRSTNGVGGLLASIDLAPENRNYIATDRTWRVIDSWTSDLVVRDPYAGAAPVLFGRPPAGKWNYLPVVPSPLLPEVQRIVNPIGAFTYKTAIPVIETPGGVAIVKAKPMRATAFDFGGPANGRVRLRLNYDAATSQLVYVRFANIQSELGVIDSGLEAFVFAPHEPAVIDATKRWFRYVAVYGQPAATVDVLE